MVINNFSNLIFAWVNVTVTSEKTDYLITLPFVFNNVFNILSGCKSTGTVIDSNQTSHTVTWSTSASIKSFSNSNIVARYIRATENPMFLIIGN